MSTDRVAGRKGLLDISQPSSKKGARLSFFATIPCLWDNYHTVLPALHSLYYLFPLYLAISHASVQFQELPGLLSWGAAYRLTHCKIYSVIFDVKANTWDIIFGNNCWSPRNGGAHQKQHSHFCFSFAADAYKMQGVSKLKALISKVIC